MLLTANRPDSAPPPVSALRSLTSTRPGLLAGSCFDACMTACWPLDNFACAAGVAIRLPTTTAPATTATATTDWTSLRFMTSPFARLVVGLYDTKEHDGLVKLKLDLHDIYNRGDEIERALRSII